MDPGSSPHLAPPLISCDCRLSASLGQQVVLEEAGAGAPTHLVQPLLPSQQLLLKGHCSRLASSSSFFFLMSWFRRQCSGHAAAQACCPHPGPCVWGGGCALGTAHRPAPRAAACTDVSQCLVQSGSPGMGKHFCSRVQGRGPLDLRLQSTSQV